MSIDRTGTPAQLSAVDYDPFAGNALSRVVPTTEPQREVWLAANLGRDASLAYNESVSLRFKGMLDSGALHGALQDLLVRHEALRAAISTNGEELLIAADVALDIAIEDHTGPSININDVIAQARHRAVETVFDLEHAPLFRAEILKLGNADYLLIITAHHIIFDGWSAGVMVRDLARFYAQRTGAGVGASAENMEPAASFGDYALAHISASSRPQYIEDEAYWLSCFSGQIPTLDLPVDKPRAAWRTFNSRRIDFNLDAELVNALRKAGSSKGASLSVTLLGSFAALLHRIASANDIVIGVPAAGQSTGGQDTLIGHCVNLLPLRLNVEPLMPLANIIDATRASMLDAYEHQEYTFGTLLQKLAIERDPSRLPLVSVMFNLDQALDANSLGFSGLDVDFNINPRNFENFEISINAVQIGGGLRLECQYNTDLFHAETVQRWLRCYEAVLRTVAQSIETEVGRVRLISDEDWSKLLDWNYRTWNSKAWNDKARNDKARNDKAKNYASDTRVHELFEQQTELNPERPAIRYGNTVLSYLQLNDRANRIAHYLRAWGVGRGALVGLHVERGTDMVAAMLGVLKSGAAYVPLDPSYPPDRLGFMLEDANLAGLITQSSIANKLNFASDRTLQLDADSHQLQQQSSTNLPVDSLSATADDCAYVIYTSGSTGKPKGVLVPHRSVVNFLESMALEPGLVMDDRVVAVTTLSFDIAVNELLLPLSVGAEIILASREQAGDGAALSLLISKSDATMLQATPATWRLLLDAGWRAPNMRHDHKNSKPFKALCGGEALTNDLAKKLAGADVALWNMYGPTETTVWSTCTLVDNPAAPIGIGRPIANTSVWVLDELNQPCVIGVAGEIWIGGAGVTLGYLNRAELTAERFVADTFKTETGAMLYRTGDRGRWLDHGDAGGMIEHMGRLDFQVKVRGYRIELGEIEACLVSHPAVSNAVVIAREYPQADVRIIGYVVPKEGMVWTDSDLREHLKKSLPDHMIPQYLVDLATIPLLPNGKIDRKALPAPQAPDRNAAHIVAPRTELEQTVATQMEAVLGMPGLSVDDNFFALGGHSLLASQLVTKLSKLLGTQIPLRTVFESPSIERLAVAISTQIAAPVFHTLAIEQLSNRHLAPMSLMQERLWFLEQLYPNRITYNAPSAHLLIGAMNESAFEQAFREMLRRQPSLRTTFEHQGNTAVQRIHDDVPVSFFPAKDLSALPKSQRAIALDKHLHELADQTFDLTTSPLFKTQMFKLSEHEHVLFFMTHHIVWDGWSFDIFYQEISALYEAFSNGRPSPLAPLAYSYGDFAAWHREWVSGAEYARQLTYWRGRLDKLSQFQELPTDKPRLPGMSGNGSTESLLIDAEKTSALHAIAKRSGATVSMVLLTLYAVLIYGYARQKSLVIGMPVRGRNTAELEQIMGYFNNTLPMQIDIRADETFSDLFARVQALVVESFASPDVPLEQLSKELAGVQGRAAPLLYQGLYSFQDARQRITSWGNLTHSRVHVVQHSATQDLSIWFVELPEGIQGGITYNSDIFTEETGVMLRERFMSLLGTILASPATTLAMLVESHAPATHRAFDSVDVVATRQKIQGNNSAVMPGTETEIRLADIWCAALKVSEISNEDNFFDLGGHSLLAMQVMATMEEKTGKRINPQKFIFETLSQIARAYDEAEAVSVSDAVTQSQLADESRAGSAADAKNSGQGLGRFFKGLIGGKKN